MSRREDRLFARFCRRPDPGLLAAVFDATAPELLRVASHLARDRAAAEDLVQETFVSAIEDRGRYDARRGVVPWLFGILMNHVQRQRRAARRAPDPQRIARSAGGDPAQAAAQNELAGALHGGLAALPEVYRSALHLHLEHGLSAKEIGEALGRPAGTVRTQLVRGMDLLRKALPPGFAAAGVAAVTAERGIAMVRDAVLARVPAAEAATIAGGGIAGGLFLGLLTMQKILAGAVFLGAIAMAVWWWQGAAGEAGGAAMDAGAVAPEHLTAAGAEPAMAAPHGGGAAESPERTRVDTSPAPSPPTLRVRVLWSDGSPAAGVGVYAQHRLDGSLVSNPLNLGRTGSDGALASTLSPGEVFVSTDRGGSAAAKLVPHSAREVVLRLDGGFTVRGRVVDGDGHPVPKATLLLYSPTWHQDGRPVGQSGDDGAFVVREVLDTSCRVGAQAPPMRPSLLVNVNGKPGTTVTALVTMGPRGHRVRGRVVDEDGSPVANAVVGLATRLPSLPKGYPDENYELSTVDADGEGRFVIEWAPEGDVVLLARKRGSDPAARLAHRPMRLDPRVDREIELVTRRLPAIAGVVRDDRGQPLASASVDAFPVRLLLGQGDRSAHRGFGDAHAVTGSDGSYRLVVMPGPWRVQSAVRTGAGTGPSTEREVEVVPDAEVRCDLVVTRGHAQRVRVLDPVGKPLADWRVSWHQILPPGQAGQARWGHQADASTDADGFAIALGLPAGELQISVQGPYRGAGSDPFPRPVHRGVASTQAELVVRLRPEHLPTAGARGRVLDAQGRPLANASVDAVEQRSGHPNSMLTDPAGRFSIGPLAPAAVRWTIHAEGHPTVDLGTVELRPDSTHDFGDVRVPAAARIAVRVTAPPGIDLAGVHVSLGPAGHPGRRRNPPAGGVFLSEPLHAGRYAVRLLGPGTHPVVREVSLVEGQHADLAVELQAAPRLALALTFSDEGARDGIAHGELRIRDAAGALLVHEAIFGYFDDLPARLLRRELALLPGDYAVEATDHAGRTVRRPLTVGTGGAPALALDLR